MLKYAEFQVSLNEETKLTDEKIFDKIFTKFPPDSKTKRAGVKKIMLTGNSATIVGKKDYESIVQGDLNREQLIKLATLMKAKI